MSRTIIIGNGIAGYTVASTLSKAGAQVTQYSEEPYPFYSRIKLPQALGNKQALLTLPASAAPPFLAMGKVVRVDAERRTVILDDGTEDSYDALVLATGSRGRFLPQFEGIENVSVLRTLSDATYLTEHLQEPVCVLGGGLLDRWVCGTRHPEEQPLHRRDIRRGDRHIQALHFPELPVQRADIPADRREWHHSDDNRSDQQLACVRTGGMTEEGAPENKRGHNPHVNIYLRRSKPSGRLIPAGGPFLYPLPAKPAF
jgi:hypothetical protein